MSWVKAESNVDWRAQDRIFVHGVLTQSDRATWRFSETRADIMVKELGDRIRYRRFARIAFGRTSTGIGRAFALP